MDIDNIVQKYSNEYNVPKNLIHAIIKIESGGNTYAIRHEPGYRWTVKPYSKYHWNSKTEEISQKTSWGLMQVMGAVARERGFEDNYLAKLCNPDIGIKYGVKHLKHQYNRYGSWKDAISAYNQGSNRKVNGQYKNQEYVNKVLREWNNGQEQKRDTR